jgi:tetratricopeptide (TPR) repeat protein
VEGRLGGLESIHLFRRGLEWIAGHITVPIPAPGAARNRRSYNGVSAVPESNASKVAQARSLENFARELFAVNYSCEEALKCIDSSLCLCTNYGALLLRADILSCLECYEEGLRTVDAAIELDPDDPEGYANKAQILCDVGDYQNAESLARKALEMSDADLVPSEVFLQSIYLALTEAVAGQGRIEEARTLLHEAEERGAGGFRVE